MKILQVVGTMNRGGAETLLMNVLRHIDKEQFEFYFLCNDSGKFDYEDEIKNLGATIVKIPPQNKIGTVKYIKEIKKVIKNNNIDIVHAHTYYNSMFAIIAAKMCGIKKRIVHSHNTKDEENPNIKRKLYYFVSKIIINILANKFYACGNEAAKSLFFTKKYEIINNGIETEKFVYNEQARNEIRKELGIEEDSIVIGHVGRFFEQKNHKFIIEIFNEYQKNNEKSVLLLVGRGPLKEEIENKVKEYNIQEKVKFLGVREDVNKLYNAMDLFLMPSLFEGLAVVLIEAQTNGLKCLISDTITKEAKLTEDVTFYSLTKTSKDWSEFINSINKERKNNINRIIERGYDINYTVKKLSNEYKG